jgi:hypothetical protein
MIDTDAPLLKVPAEIKDQFAEAVKMDDEGLATVKWKNKCGHTELAHNFCYG